MKVYTLRDKTWKGRQGNKTQEKNRKQAKALGSAIGGQTPGSGPGSQSQAGTLLPVTSFPYSVVPQMLIQPFSLGHPRPGLSLTQNVYPAASVGNTSFFIMPLDIFFLTSDINKFTQFQDSMLALPWEQSNFHL